MDITPHIADTAFLVNESRARMVNISHDIYAEHWVLPERYDYVRQLWDDFAAAVYPHDDLELSIRNRYFFERLQKFATAEENAVFVNIGAGLTSYPFLLEQPIRCIEVDYPEVVAFKEQRLKSLQDKGIIPDRLVAFFAADLNKAHSQCHLAEFLSAHLHGRLSFILLEGVTYYLERPVLASILRIFRNLQIPGSVLAFDFWKPNITMHPVFRRLKTFFAERFDHKEGDYHLFDEHFIRSINGYQIVEISTVVEQERTYAASSVLKNYEQILPENYAVLRRS